MITKFCRKSLLAALLACGLLLTALPANAQQTTQQVFALPGTLRKATDQPFGSYFVLNDGTLYGIVGETPAVETQIETLRDQIPSPEVKVWGTLYPNGRLNTTPEIVASSVLLADGTPGSAATPTPTPQTSVTDLPIATSTAAVLNVRSGPDTAYPVVGQLTFNQGCPIVGRDLAATWWQIRCSSVLTGWVAAHLVTVSGSTANVPITDTNVPPAPATPTPAPPPPIAGWAASYYANRDLAGAPAAIQTVPDVNFNWGAGSPNPQLPPDNFSARFEQTINFAASNYRFTAQYDDGARVYLDGQLIIDDWRDGSERTSTVDRAVAAGNHSLKIEYFEAYGGALIRFMWASVGSGAIAPTPVPPPPSAVVPPPVPGNGDWQATYWNNPDLAGAPVYAQVEPRSSNPIDKNWGTNSPAPGVNNTNWSARYVANYYLDAGDYTFEAESDDGMRVYLDGQMVIDAWSDGYKKKTNSFTGVGQGSHQITVEFYQRGGNALLKVRWWKNNQEYHLDE